VKTVQKNNFGHKIFRTNKEAKLTRKKVKKTLEEMSVEGINQAK